MQEITATGVRARTAPADADLLLSRMALDFAFFFFHFSTFNLVITQTVVPPTQQ